MFHRKINKPVSDQNNYMSGKGLQTKCGRDRHKGQFSQTRNVMNIRQQFNIRTSWIFQVGQILLKRNNIQIFLGRGEEGEDQHNFFKIAFCYFLTRVYNFDRLKPILTSILVRTVFDRLKMVLRGHSTRAKIPG